ncbi:MAG: DUF4143 domain-containing protein [Roseburia sp.]|nr:DUF4143 domain-containing protein [Roseburia sp.]
MAGKRQTDGCPFWFPLLVYLPALYSENTIKHIVKQPKLYFMDTGPACRLTLRNHLETPALSAAAGAMSEDYVISEIVKSQVNQDMMCDAVSAIAEILMERKLI